MTDQLTNNLERGPRPALSAARLSSCTFPVPSPDRAVCADSQAPLVVFDAECGGKQNTAGSPVYVYCVGGTQDCADIITLSDLGRPEVSTRSGAGMSVSRVIYACGYISDDS